jgi:hypothetical protein
LAKELAGALEGLVALVVQTAVLAEVQILAVPMVVALALTMPQRGALCVSFTPVVLVHSHQQTQVICNGTVYSH